ncbi:uncharacterized protein BKCO1_1000277 [Diplodia corticola]|uniref:Transmembrane protein n=1 Tax=Diplodia corticola TaxID=236234 RepID=A0A1J9SLC8_9PEZI|nr:uncharacterized protein BKCO1_1000277 [Diplodia corticola]OJD40421.1 hypothetical protein BKCO1_1000277 [Diplodia corticola]
MKFSFASAFALSSLFLGALAAPTMDVSNDLIARTDVKADAVAQITVLSVLTELQADVEVHTAKINSTCSGLSTGLDLNVDLKTAAIVAIKAELTAIIDVVTSATVKLQGCEAGADVDVVVGLVVKLVLEILFTLNASCKILGVVSLTLLNVTINLVISVIANLLIAVEAIVGGVIALAWGYINVCVDVVLPGLGQLFVGLAVTLHGECGCVNQ